MNAKMAWVTFCAVISCWPVAGGKVRFYGLTTALSVGTQKKQPPYLAFAETIRHETPNGEWEEMSLLPAAPLSTVSVKEAAAVTPVSHVVQLEPLRIDKSRPEVPAAAEDAVQTGYIAPMMAETALEPETDTPDVFEDQEWMKSLPAGQRDRLVAARERGAKIQEEADEAAPVRASPVPASAVAPVVPVRAIAAATDGETEISGVFKVDAIAFLGETYNHHFEIFNEQEGIVVARGEVNARKATYKIRVRGRTGRVVARLTDETGKSIGQDSFYLSQIHAAQSLVRGPELVLRQQRGIAANGNSFYPGQRFAGFKASALSGASEGLVSKDGGFEIADIQKGSMTVLRAEAKNHAQTVAIVPAGERADLTLFPKSWVDSLRRIVAEQRRSAEDDPDSPVIWGRVVQDGRPRAGVNVQIESSPDTEVIYFNQLLLPDPELKATSENGLFAFIGAAEGFHSLVARVGDRYFSHTNAVIENGSVTLANLESTLRTEPANIRVYDAFAGTPQPASIAHQGVEQDIEVGESGTATVNLPLLHRLSLAQVRPEAPYSAASYLLNDEDGFVHLPLIRADWLRALQGYSKISDVPGTSVVIGFVPDEDFVAEAIDSGSDVQIVYFNARGEPVPRGIAGGGFVVYGLSAGVREIIVEGARSKLLATRVVPSDPRSLVVLTYRAN